MKNLDNYITAEEYAHLHMKDTSSIRGKCIRGTFKTAVKIGGRWLIDRKEPYSDHREKSYRDKKLEVKA